MIKVTQKFQSVSYDGPDAYVESLNLEIHSKERHADE